MRYVSEESTYCVNGYFLVKRKIASFLLHIQSEHLFTLYISHFIIFSRCVCKNCVSVLFSFVSSLWYSVLVGVVSTLVFVQSLSCAQPFGTPWTTAIQASLSVANSRSLLKLQDWVGDAIPPFILCQPLLFPPSFFPSIRVFSNESGSVFYGFVLTVFLSNCMCSFCPCFNFN